METVTIGKEVLEYLTRRTMEWYEYDGLSVEHECDREAAIHLDAAIKALNLQPSLDAEHKAAMEERSRIWREEQARKAAEGEAQND